MPRLIYGTKAPVPVEALRLTEDIRAIERARRELQSVDAYNITDDPDKDVLWLMIQKLKMFQRHAEQKLRTEYLDPRRKKIQRSRTTVV